MTSESRSAQQEILRQRALAKIQERWQQVPQDVVEREHLWRELQIEKVQLEIELDDLRKECAESVGRCLPNAEDRKAEARAMESCAELVRVSEELKQTHEQLQSALDAMTDGLVLQRVDGTIVLHNQAAAKMMGTQGSSLQQKIHDESAWKAIHPDGTAFPEIQFLILETLRTQRPLRDVVIGISEPDRDITWVKIQAIPLPESGLVLTTFANITDKKKAEESLFFQSQLLHQVEQSIAAIDRHGTVSYFNPAAERLFGWSAEEVLGKSMFDLSVPPSMREEAAAAVSGIGRGEPWKGEFPLLKRNGETFIAEISDSPIRDTSGNIVGFASLVQDVTGKKRVEAALRDNEQLLQSLTDSLPVCVLLLDRSLRLQFLNRTAAELSIRPSEAILGKHYSEIMGEAYYQNSLPRLQACLRGDPQEYEVPPPAPFVQDPTAWFWVKNVPHIRNGEVVGILLIAKDITQMKREAVLRNQILEIVESASDAIIRTDLDGKVQSWNAAAERMYGYQASEMIGESFDKIIPEELRAEAQKAADRVSSEARVVHLATVRHGKNGARVDIDLTISPIKDYRGQIVALSRIARDVTQRNALEKQLQHARRLEVIGKLAGGIAHDFNNFLQVMRLHIEHLTRHQGIPNFVRSPLEQLQVLTDRAANMTSQLLMFARRQTVQIQPSELNGIVTQAMTLLAPLIGEQIMIWPELSTSPLTILADSGMMVQIILNLSLNARDAMPDGGMLRLITSGVDWNQPIPERFPEAKPGKYACLSVVDSGCGMNSEVLSHLFEPFFTTKDAGKGTGLGLAAVYGIVQQHQGFITVTSVENEGSTFNVYMPRTDKTPLPVSRKSAAPKPRSQPRTLLFVEDEPLLRKIGVEMLRAEGYHVIEAANGPDALALFEQHRANIDLLISDMVMPGGVSGLQLGTHLQRIKPGLPVILLSGYSEEIVSAENSEMFRTTFLAKPYRYPALLGLIERSLAHS